MAETCTIRVLDDSDAAIQGTLFLLEGVQEVTGGKGDIEISVIVKSVHFLTVSHSDYVTGQTERIRAEAVLTGAPGARFHNVKHAGIVNW